MSPYWYKQTNHWKSDKDVNTVSKYLPLNTYYCKGEKSSFADVKSGTYLSN